MAVVRVCACAAREAALWAAALALHLLLAFAAAHLLLGVPPALPEPRLLVDSLEVVVAETESEVPAEASAPALPAAQSPRAEPAPMLTDAASPVALPMPPPASVPVALPLSPAPTPPTLPAPDRAPNPTALPEIALPPARPAPPKDTPREAAGATARIDKPRLVTDLSRLVKHYPTEARRNGWEGTVVLDLAIAADGTLQSAAIHTSSGHRVLDRAALRMIRSARFAGGPGRLLQPIDYRLR